MKIQKVQSNQTAFGTKVYLESSTKDLILKSKAKQKFFKHINKLENNGVEDVFVLKHSTDNLFGTKWLRGIVFEKRGDEIYKTPWGSIDPLFFDYLGERKNTYANLLKLYKNAKYEWTMRKANVDNLKLFETNFEKIK